MLKLFCVLNNKPFRVNFQPFSLGKQINLHTTVESLKISDFVSTFVINLHDFLFLPPAVSLPRL